MEDSNYFKVLTDLGRERREHNKTCSTVLLAEKKIPFVLKNNGVHLIVADRFDFWPSTGLFMERGIIEGRKRIQGRGVFNLIRHLNQE